MKSSSERGNRASRHRIRPLNTNTDFDSNPTEGGSSSPPSFLEAASTDMATVTATAITTTTTTDPTRMIYQYRKAIAHPTQQCLFTCYIPPSRVGAVIGRGGKNILHIQRKAMKKSMHHGNEVRLSVVSHGGASGPASGPASGSASASGSGSGSNASPDHEDDLNAQHLYDDTQNSVENAQGKDEAAEDRDLWTPVMIRGDPCGSFAAARLLVPLLNTGLPDHTSHTHIEEDLDVRVPSETCTGMDDVVLDIPIHRAKHSVIIGKKGLTIANLSAHYNVRIMVPHRNMEKTTSANINIVQLEGNLDNVEKCLAHMLRVVCSLPLTTITDKSPNANGNGEGMSTELDANGNKNAPSSPTNGPGISIAVTSKKESKYVEKTITVPPELYHLVPSLGRIRIVGKSTNTVIRRKKFSEVLDDTGANVNEEGDSVPPEAEDTNSETPKKKKIDAPCTTQLIISGKNEAVKNAIMQLQKILSPGSKSEADDEKGDGAADSDEEAEKNSKSADYQPRRSGRGRGRAGQRRGGRGRGRGRQKMDLIT